jgi:hypothetical protein
MLRLIGITVLASVIAVVGADAQIAVGGSAANIPTPQGTIGATAPNVGGAGSSNSPGNYGPGYAGPGAVGPGRLGPGAYGPGTWGRAPLLAGLLVPLRSVVGDGARGPCGPCGPFPAAVRGWRFVLNHGPPPVPFRYMLGPRVCRLAAGGRQIRTSSPTTNGIAVGGRSGPSQIHRWRKEDSNRWFHLRRRRFSEHGF